MTYINSEAYYQCILFSQYNYITLELENKKNLFRLGTTCTHTRFFFVHKRHELSPSIFLPEYLIQPNITLKKKHNRVYRTLSSLKQSLISAQSNFHFGILTMVEV